MAVEQAPVEAPRVAITIGRRLARLDASEPARISAARRAVRTGLVTIAAFSIGRWAVGSVTVAVFATFTGLAITGIADFGGSIRGRAAAVTTTVLFGIGLTALGTWISAHGPWVGCAVMFAVVATIALTGLLGGYAAAGSNALILFYVVAAGSAAPASVIPDRLEGVALGGALALAAAVALWPEPEHSETMIHLGGDLGDLAARVASLAADVIDVRASANLQRPGIRASVDALIDRPAAPTGAQRAELYLINDLERLDGLVSTLERGPAPNPVELPRVRWCATTLRRCGEALAAKSTLNDSELDPAPEAARGEPFSLLTRLAAVTDAVSSHTRAALGSASDGIPAEAFATRPARRAGWGDVLHGARRFRANLTLRSVHVHDALRLGAGLALASAAVDAFGLQHGFWVAFATLTVIKSNLRATGRSVSEAVSGTLIGFLIAFALIAGLEPSVGWYVVMLPVVVTAAIYANVAVGFLAGQAGFTLVIVVLFNLLGPAGWRIGIVRVVDVAAGALAGLVIGALAWPRGAASTIGDATADLLEAAASYLAATARGFVGRPALAIDAAMRQLAVDAALRAESSFAQYLTEQPPPADLTGWAHWLSAGNRLWYAADLISATPHGSTEDAARTVEAAERLLAAHSALGARLRHRRAPRGAAAEHASAVGSDLPAWLDDRAAEAAAQPGDHEEVPSDV